MNGTAALRAGSPERSGGLPVRGDGPTPEVLARATRRQFTAKYKAEIVRRADACKKPSARELERKTRNLEKRLVKAEAIIAFQKKHSRAPGDPPEGSRDRRGRLMQAVSTIRSQLGVREGCAALGLPRATWYRAHTHTHQTIRNCTSSPRALSQSERQTVVDLVHEPRFCDMAVPQIWATALDEGKYLCSRSTMYRILNAQDEVHERRAQLRRPVFTKPELLATRKNQVWTWDITKLKGPRKWNYFHLYVILDIFSRKVVGWMVAQRESAALAKKLIAATISKERIAPGQLTIHADRGSSMTSKDVAFLMADLGVLKTHNCPHVSNDNPFSESHFKTLKYRPEFHARFGSLQDARAFSVRFFEWYNGQHRHSGIGFMTPSDVHHGRAPHLRAQRAGVLDAAYRLHPEPFVRKPPTPPALPSAVWINPPAETVSAAL